MRRLIWSPDALGDLVDIQSYLAEFNPAAAARFFIRLKASGDSLAEFADRGRSIGRGRRELVIVKPYVIRYIVLDAEVRILSIRHSARRLET
jgi:plasmid stabilization system protein ParE